MALRKSVLLLFSCVLMLIGVNSYEIRTLERCYLDTLWLGSSDKSALNFSLGNFKFDPYSSADSDFKCSFHIEAEKNEKIIAVVQKMNLRGTEPRCLDFVEFSDIPKLTISHLYDRSKNPKKQVCGTKNVSMMSLPTDMVLYAYNKYTLPQNVYITNKNELKVKVSLSREPLRPDQTLDFQIIFTSAKTGSECRDREYDCGNNTCIWKGFHKDGFVNCPYVGCTDEDSCDGPTIKYSSGSGTTIIICAVVSMLSVLGMFLFCLFICRRCKVLCWSHPAPTTRDPSSRVNVSTSHPNEPVQPSAPPLISLHDKDLPPSYDSLFPPRSTGAGVSLEKDDGIERCRRSRNISFKKVHTVRVEGGTGVRYSSRNIPSQNSGNRGESSVSNDPPSRSRRQTNRPYNHGPNRSQHSTRNPPHDHGGNSRSRGRKHRGSHNQNRRVIQNQTSRNNRGKGRGRSRSESAVNRRNTEWVRSRRNSEGSYRSKWYHDLWQVCCL